MPTATFIRQLFILSGVTAVALFGVNQLDTIHPYRNFSWISLGFFVLLTIAMYLTGILTARSSNKSAFMATILGFTFAKILLSFVVVLLYYQMAQPTSKAFVIPFFIVYLVFTVFETWFMMELGRQER